MCPQNAIDLRGYTDAQITAMIDGLLEELEKLTAEYDGLKAEFDARLRALDADDA